MGQYHIVANLDKCQSINPHKFGAGLKLIEQVVTYPGTGAALIVLLASASSGGADLPDVSIVGAWRGDRIAFVGDYDETVYATPLGEMSGVEIYASVAFADVSDAVCGVLEQVLHGHFVGDGWRTFVPGEPPDPHSG